MKVVAFLLTFFSNGDACQKASQNISEAFTGDASYWNPTFKGE